MSCVSEMYNCTLTWLVENFSVFWYQRGETFCVPEAQLEIFSGKWVLNLRKQLRDLVFCMRRSATGTSDEQVFIDLKVSLLDNDGCSHGSVTRNGIKFGEGQSDIDIRFNPDLICILPKDTLKLLIQIRFCDLTPLVLHGTVRTKMRIESSSFTCLLKNLSSIEPSDNLSIPIDVHLEKSPNFKLLLSNTTSFDDPISAVLQKLTSNDEKTSTCDILVLANVSKNTDPMNNLCFSRLFFLSSATNDSQKIPTPGLSRLELSFTDFLKCTFSFADGMNGTILEQMDYTYPSLKPETSSLSSSYLGQSLFNEKKFMDITLKVRNKTYKAHKAVLSSGSPVFNAMFDHEMKEQVSGIVCIEDVEPDTLERLLTFMYTNTIDPDAGFEKTSNLYVAADKYQISSLKSQCSAGLISMLLPENVCRVLHLAYMHNDEDLKLAAKKLFCENPTEVLESKEWNTFMENCIRGKSAMKSSVAQLLSPSRLRRSFSEIKQRIQIKNFLKF